MFKKIGLFILGMVSVVGTAAAESALDATLMAAHAADIADTVDELKVWLIGIAFVVGIAFFAVNMTKRGISKAGGR